MVSKDTDEAKPEEQDNEFTLDMSQASVRRMIAAARERGYITVSYTHLTLPTNREV